MWGQPGWQGFQQHGGRSSEAALEDDSPQNVAKLGRVNHLGARNSTARSVPDLGREVHVQQKSRIREFPWPHQTSTHKRMDKYIRVHLDVKYYTPVKREKGKPQVHPQAD